MCSAYLHITALVGYTYTRHNDIFRTLIEVKVLEHLRAKTIAMKWCVYKQNQREKAKI
jgi:hypothetical protein